jgi:hypothetical protein
MRRLADVVVWKFVSKDRSFRYEDMVLTSYEGKLRIVNFVKEAVEPTSIEGLGHIQEYCACQFPIVNVPGYSFYKQGEL